MLIVNTKGELAETSLEALWSLQRLTDRLELPTLDTKQDLIHMMPRLFWALRDYKHNIENRNGRVISANQYLDNFIFDEHRFLKATQNRKKLRRRVIKYFPERDCVSFVHPSQQDPYFYNRSLEDLDPEF